MGISPGIRAFGLGRVVGLDVVDPAAATPLLFGIAAEIDNDNFELWSRDRRAPLHERLL
jgi:hypothetical protein